MAIKIIGCKGSGTFVKGIEDADSPYDKDHIVSEVSLDLAITDDDIINTLDNITNSSNFSQTIEDDASSDILYVGTRTGVTVTETASQLNVAIQGKSIQMSYPRDVNLKETAIEREELRNDVVTWTLPLPVTGIFPGDTVEIFNDSSYRQSFISGSVFVTNISYSGSTNGWSMTIEGTLVI